MNFKMKSTLYTRILPYLWPHRTQLALYLAMMDGAMGDWLETISTASTPLRN